jgi:putative endonuclease
MPRHRPTGYSKGVWAERGACLLLLLKGYRILACRYKSPFGEVDIIAQKGQTVVAVEVKNRPSHAATLTAISPTQWSRIARTMAAFLHHNPRLNGTLLRFDAVGFSARQFPVHIRDAWRPNF